MKKRQIDDRTLEIPEIPPDAVLRRSRHQLPANARMPRKKVLLELDVEIVSWFEAEARCSDLNRNDHINEALRHYIIDLVGDKSQSPSLNKHQRNEVQRLINETLAQNW